MRHLIFISLLFISFLTICNCNAQQPSVTTSLPKIRTTGKLNINDIKQSKRKFQYDNDRQLIKNDSLFKFIIEGNTMQKESVKMGENFKLIEVYNSKTLNLISEIKLFFSIPLIYREYDLNGNIINVINYDKNFKLSIGDIVAIAKAKFKVDITKNITRLNVTRSDENSKLNQHYTLFLPIDERKSRYIIIDDSTGKVTDDRIVFAVD